MRMRILIKTPMQKLSFTMILLFPIIVALFTFHEYIAGIIGVAALIILSFLWYKLLGEELFIYDLKRNSGRLKISEFQCNYYILLCS